MIKGDQTLKGQKEAHFSNIGQNKVGVAILVSENIYSREKKIKRNIDIT